MGRTGTIGSAIAIIALLGATLVPTAASAVGESDQDTRTPKTETVRTIVDLPSSMRLDSAIGLSNDLQGEVRGYRYSNGPLVGEFHPTATYTSDEFLKDLTAVQEFASHHRHRSRLQLRSRSRRSYEQAPPNSWLVRTAGDRHIIAGPAACRPDRTNAGRARKIFKFRQDMTKTEQQRTPRKPRERNHLSLKKYRVRIAAVRELLGLTPIEPPTRV